MDKRAINIILVLLLISLAILLVWYSTKLNPTLNKLFTTTYFFNDQQLTQQMRQFKAPGTNLTLDKGFGGGDPQYGGTTVNGVLTQLSTIPVSIKNKNGIELAKSIMTFTIKYLDGKERLQTIKLTAAIQLPDGTYHTISSFPAQIPNAVVNSNAYIDKIGTPVFGLFRVQTSKGIQTMKDQGKTAAEIAEAEKIFSLINDYETSWKQEIDQLILGSDKGKLEFLFPIIYLTGSFDPALGNFSTRKQ